MVSKKDDGSDISVWRPDDIMISLCNCYTRQRRRHMHRSNLHLI